MCKSHNPRRIDKCLKPLLEWLKEVSYTVVASCCGHSKYPMTIVVQFTANDVPFYVELLSNTLLPRTKRFYKKDKEGYYYIPETLNRGQ